MKGAFVIAAGLIDLGLVVFHLLFWRLFGWPESLAPSGRLNVAITQTMNLMLTYVFAVYAVSLLVLGADVSRAMLLAAVGFGVIRVFLQFRLFGVRSQASRAFVLIATIGTILHLIPALIGG